MQLLNQHHSMLNLDYSLFATLGGHIYFAKIMGVAQLTLFVCFIFHVILAVASSRAEPRLQSYNVDKLSLTVSGISSGGMMATQFHFIYSSEVKGVGIFAAGPYLCGYGGPLDASVCMLTPYIQNVAGFIAEANILSATTQINSVNNLRSSRVYLFHGKEDSVVHPTNGEHVRQMYAHYGANITTEFTMAAGHGQPVNGNGHGGPCANLNLIEGFINECGYNGAYHMFKWLYGINIIEPASDYVADGELLTYDQVEFFVIDPLVSSMSRSGLIYVPKACKNKTIKCRFHIAFHGCMANEFMIGDGFATKTQYLEVAELNNIIILFPQTASTLVSIAGCWDWFGYTGLTSFATKIGNQPYAVHRMMSRVMG